MKRLLGSGILERFETLTIIRRCRLQWIDYTSAETQLSFHNGSWCRMSGVVTEVGFLPTVKVWQKTTKYLGCLDKGCVKDCYPTIFSKYDKCEPSLELMMNDLFVHDGCLNGQRIVSYAILNYNFHGDREYFLPVRKDRVYRIEFEAQDMMYHFWVVKKVMDVTNEPHPQVFSDWKQYWEQPVPTPTAWKKQLPTIDEHSYGSYVSQQKTQTWD